MRNFVVAQAVPAASYQLLVFAWQLLHLFPSATRDTSLLRGKHTTPLQVEKAQVEGSRNKSANRGVKLEPTCSTDITLSTAQHIHRYCLRMSDEEARSPRLERHEYTVPVTLLWEVLLAQGGLSVWLSEWVCESEFVCAGSSLAWNSAALAVSFPGPRCSQADKLCHAFICHSGCYLSLPFTLASWYALSPAPGILSVSLKEKKRDFSRSGEAVACQSSSCRWSVDKKRAETRKARAG